MKPLNNKQLMIVDDDERLHSLLTRFLNRHQYFVVSAYNARHARELLQWFQIDAMILDVMMPDETGFEFARWLAPRYDFPILMLTAMDDTKDKLEGLKNSDDYLTKPFEPEELLLRIHNLLKRQNHQASIQKPTFKIGNLYFDETRQELKTDNDDIIHLTGTEKYVLSQLTRNVGQVVSRDDLSQDDDPGRGLDVLITKLRKKINDDPRAPRWIQTVRGEGYKFVPDI